MAPVSCPLSNTNSREEIAHRLPRILSGLMAFDEVDLRFEAAEPAAEPTVSTTPFVWGNGAHQGALMVTRKSSAFTEGEVQILRLIAEQVAAALVLQESRQQLARAELVLTINNRIAANLEPQALLRSIAQTLRQTLACDFVVISIADPEAGELRALAMDFPESRGIFQEGTKLPIEGSMVGKVYTTRKRRLIRSLDELDPADMVRARAAREGIELACFCPLVHQDRALVRPAAGKS